LALYFQRLIVSISELLKTIRRRRGARRFQLRNENTEPLEVRCLLAGNVAAVVANGDLMLQGDSAANTVTIVVENGDTIVRGLDGTTINGGSADFVAAAGTNRITDDLFADLGQGDDVLLVSGVAVGNRVSIRDLQGNNQIGLDAVSVGRHLTIWTGAGNDTVSLNSTTLSRWASLTTGAGNDLVRIVDSSAAIVDVKTASGNDNIVMENVQAGRHGRVRSGSGDDTVAVSGSRFGRTLRVNAQSGADVVDLSSVSVGRRTVIHGGRGADAVRIGTSSGLARLVTRTGSGSDAVEIDSTTSTKRRRVRQAESRTVDATQLETRLNDPTTGALTQSTAAQTFFDSLLGNTAPAASQIANVSVEENAANTVVELFPAFNDLQDADADLTFTVDSNSNASLFTSTNIDAATGQLTLDYADNQTGTANISVRATDTGGLSATTTFTATVTAAASTTPNSFDVLQTASAGQVLGQVTASSIQSDAVYQLEDSSAPVQLRLNSDDHLSGATAAKVVLVEYLDLQCPICRTYHPIIQQLKQDFPNDLLVVTRHLPLPSLHPNAEAAAIAAEAAGRQGMFDEMVDRLFVNRSQWALEADPTTFFADYAAGLGLNATQFASDTADTALADRVARDASSASAVGASGTPTFFLQGTTVSPAANQTDFAAVITQAVADFDSAAVPFVVDHQTGNLSLVSPSTLNATTTPQYTVNIRATDAAGTSQVVPVSIQVNTGT
jgi:protein-disulfide isomerase